MTKRAFAAPDRPEKQKSVGAGGPLRARDPQDGSAADVWGDAQPRNAEHRQMSEEQHGQRRAEIVKRLRWSKKKRSGFDLNVFRLAAPASGGGTSRS